MVGWMPELARRVRLAGAYEGCSGLRFGAHCTRREKAWFQGGQGKLERHQGNAWWLSSQRQGARRVGGVTCLLTIQSLVLAATWQALLPR